MAQLCFGSANVIGRAPVTEWGNVWVGVARYGEGLVCECLVVALRSVNVVARPDGA
jgi:hypothetical protein